MIRSRLLPVLLAFAPLAFTGCTKDEKPDFSKTDAAQAPDLSPKPAAEALVKSLNDLAACIRTVDAAYAAVVGQSATDPSDRLEALDKATVALGGTTTVTLGADLKAAGAKVLAAWDATGVSLTDPDLAKLASKNREEARAAFETLDKALQGADKSLAYHAELLRQARSALGASPGATQLVAARPAAVKLAAAGKKATDWLEYAAKAARKTATPSLVPVPVKPAAPAAEAPKAPETTPGAAPVTEKNDPSVAAANQPRIIIVEVTSDAGVEKVADVPHTSEPAEPAPSAKPDPVPEPKGQ